MIPARLGVRQGSVLKDSTGLTPTVASQVSVNILGREKKSPNYDLSYVVGCGCGGVGVCQRLPLISVEILRGREFCTSVQ